MAQNVEINGIYYLLSSDKQKAVVEANPNYYQGDIVIPSSVSYEGNDYVVWAISRLAFSNCTGLTSVYIPSSVTNIQEEAFKNCTSLLSVIIPNSVTYMGSNAFAGCTSLKDVVAGNCLGGYAFYGCTALTSITIRDNSNTKKLINPTAFMHSNYLTSIVVEEGNNFYDSRDNCNAIIETESNKMVTGCKSTNIPISVTEIGSYAFFGQSDVTSLSLSHNISKIYDYAFEGCKLQNIVAKNPLAMIYVTSFSEATLKHAILYIPMGTRWSAIYDGGWGQFINIKEMAAETGEFSYDKAFTLMNADSFGYEVYDEVNNGVRTVGSFYDIDENVPNCSWQLINIEGKNCLYNIGAKKYAAIKHGGKIELSDTPIPMNMENGGKGVIVDGDTECQWNFVLNEKVGIDQSVTAINNINKDETTISDYYDLQGRKVTNPEKGIYIVNGKKVVKK